MPFIIPPNVPYQSPIVSLPAFWDRVPIEGARLVPIEIDWQASGASCIAFNVGNLSTNPISQIAAMTVDNSASGNDVAILFPDVGQVLDIPAYETVTATVFTGGTAFYVQNIGTPSTDTTRIIVHNTVPPVLSIPKSEFSASAGANGVSLGAVSTTPIIASTVSGTLECLSITVFNGSTVAGGAAMFLQDGNANVLWELTVNFAANQNGVFNVANINGISWRFNNGLFLVVSSVVGPLNDAGVTVNSYRREP